MVGGHGEEPPKPLLTRAGLRDLARRHPLRTYVFLAYAVSWACWLPLVATGSVVDQGSGWPTDLPGLAGPAMAAVVTSWLIGGREGVHVLLRRLGRWRIPAWCWALVAGTGALSAVIALVGSGGTVGDGWSAYTGASDLGLPATFVLVLVVNGFGEETGWRGFLADGLIPRHGLLRTAGLVAVVWAGWHLPLFLVVDSFRGLGIAVVGWLGGLAAGSLVLTWLYVGGRHSVLLVAVWHTVFNFGSGTARMSGAPAAVSSTAVMALAVLILVAEVRARRAVTAT
jgi:uncharacterized protein